MAQDEQFAERLRYAFGHLVGSHNVMDAHSGDSRDLAHDVMDELVLTDREQGIVEILAEVTYAMVRSAEDT